MRTLFGVALVGMLALVGGAGADDKKDEKIDGKKLVGKWEPKEAAGKAVIEFTKDGKLSITAGPDVKYEGTYKVEGTKLTLTIKAGENEVKKSATILKLTDDLLEAEGEDGKKMFTRIKAK